MIPSASYGPYDAVCVRVKDGDSFVALVDVGFGALVRIPVRIRNLWCDELDTDTGEAARDFLVELISEAPLVIKSYHDRRSFERWICDVWTHQASVAESVITAGHGKSTR